MVRFIDRLVQVNDFLGSLLWKNRLALHRLRTRIQPYPVTFPSDKTVRMVTHNLSRAAVTAAITNLPPRWEADEVENDDTDWAGKY